MIEELQKKDYSKVRHLLNVDHCNLEPKSVVEQHNPGRIFVDNKLDIKTALIWSQGIEGFYIAGDEKNRLFNNVFNEFIDSTLLPMLKITGCDGFEISGINPAWNEVLEKLLSNRNLSSFEQYVYRYEDGIPDFKNDKNVLGKICKIDKDFLLMNEIKNMNFVLNILETYWGAIDRFLERGIAYCILLNHEVVSICYSSFFSNKVHVMGIETLKEHRRNGLGKNVAKALLAEYKNKGILPYWDCTATNVASWKLAEKLGLSRVHEYRCYGFYF